MIPLVLVHGFMGGGAQWQMQLDALTPGRVLIAIDLPGFGAHAHLPVIDTIAGFADWVIAELRDRGIDRYDLLGHSMGGMIAQEMARRDAARIRGLILYGTGAVGVLPGRFETIAESKARARTDGARATARRIAATWFLHGTRAPGFADCAAIAETAGAAAIAAGLDAMERWSGVDALPRIDRRTLLIWGDGDRTYPWEQIHQLWTRLPDAGLAVVPGCAHAVHAEKPDLFNALVADFLTSLDTGASAAR